MDSQRSRRRFEIVAAAGRHDRRGVPARADLPLSWAELESLGPPELFMEGRKRAVPCQLLMGTAGPELWWFLDSLRANHGCTYTLVFGGRERHSPRRAQFEATSTGLAFEGAGRRMAEFLLPQRGVPRLQMRDGNGPLANLEHRARPAWLEEGRPVQGSVDPQRTLHRARRGRAVTREGPILGDVHVEYDYFDANDRPVLAEHYHVRCFVPTRRAVVMDFRVTCRATAGALTIFDPDPGAYQRVPSLRLHLARPPIGEPRSACGAKGVEECVRVDPSDVWIPCGRSVLGILLHRHRMTWPAVFGSLDGTTLDIEPKFSAARWVRAPVRLALGEELAFDYRFVRVDADSWEPRRDFVNYAFPVSVAVREVAPTS